MKEHDFCHEFKKALLYVGEDCFQSLLTAHALHPIIQTENVFAITVFCQVLDKS